MSTLHVENLKGPTSGANANKIIVPSGQTLTAPGHVIQMKRVAVNTVTSTTSSSYVTHMSAQFDATPTVGNLVIVEGNVTGYRNPAANWASTCAIWIGSEGMSSGDTNFTAAGRSGYAGDDNYGSQGILGDYIGHGIASTGHKTITSSHVSGGNPTFYLKVSELSGQTSYWGAGSATTSHGYATDITSMTLWEVAQ